MSRFLRPTGLMFQHIPRTGGCWREKALDESGFGGLSRWVRELAQSVPQRHNLIGHYHRNRVPEIRFIASWVRHPVEWYRSVWTWMRTAHNRRALYREWGWHPKAEAARAWSKNFDDWVDRMVVNSPAWCTRIFEGFVGPEGAEFCNFIGRMETMEEDFFLVLEHNGYDVTDLREKTKGWGRINPSLARIEVSDETRRKIMKIECRVIRRFYSDENVEKRFYENPRNRTNTRRGRKI